MDSGDSLLRWFAKLRACGTLDAVCREWSCALGALAQGENVGVFLLDEAKENLFLASSWPEQAEQPERLPVPVATYLDPLCFSLQTGTHYIATLEQAASMKQAGMGRGRVLAVPFAGTLDVMLGGVLVAVPEGFSASDIMGVQLLCFYGGALIEVMLQRDRDRAVTLTLQKDINQLKARSEQEQMIARELIIGSSPGIAHVRNLIIKAGSANAAVLITGETGTGKELAATAIHSLSSRSTSPLVKINCGAMPAQLLESELFGHIKGAFTGAGKDNPGLLRSADGGSILLDEIGDMPLELQVKILRFLQERELRPVGDVKTYPVDVRIIAATNKNLDEAMERGEFRPDLFHRLASFRIAIPPLRERPEDIIPLANHFFKKFAAQNKRETLSLAPDGLLSLCAKPFYGNVRELANVVERAILLADPAIHTLDMAQTEIDGTSAYKVTLSALLASYEEQVIQRTLDSCGGNRSQAAAVLGIPRSTLQSKLDKTAPR